MFINYFRKEARQLLNRLNKSARDYYRSAYKKLLSENRILDKKDDDNISEFEIKMRQLKMNREFKKITWQTMFMIDDKNENSYEEDIKKEMINHLMSVENLQYMIRKDKIMKKKA